MARTEHHEDLEEEEEEGGKKKRVDLSLSQVTGAGAATLAAATAASYLNVYGTVIGAAVMAALSTLVSPMLQHWFSRSGEQARQLAEKAVARTGVPVPNLARTKSDSDTEAMHGNVRSSGVEQTRELPETTGDTVTGDTDAGDPPSEPEGRRGWRSLAVPAAAVFILVMLVILVFELFTGRSLTSWTRGSEEPSAPTLFGGSVSAPVHPEEGTEAPDTPQEGPDAMPGRPEEQAPGTGEQSVPGPGRPKTAPRAMTAPIRHPRTRPWRSPRHRASRFPHQEPENRTGRLPLRNRTRLPLPSPPHHRKAETPLLDRPRPPRASGQPRTRSR